MLVTASKHDTTVCLSAKGVNLFLWSLFLSVGKIVALANLSNSKAGASKKREEARSLVHLVTKFKCHGKI